MMADLDTPTTGDGLFAGKLAGGGLLDAPGFFSNIAPGPVAITLPEGAATTPPDDPRPAPVAKDAPHSTVRYGRAAAAPAARCTRNVRGCEVATMPNKFLHGNGYRCVACQLRQDAGMLGLFWGSKGAALTCNLCDGTGRIPRDTADIIRDAVAEAARFHWKISAEMEIA